MTAFPSLDARRPLTLGVHVGQQNATMGELIDLWRRLDDTVDWISIWDHLYEAPPAGGTTPHYEAVATLGALAAVTSKARIGCLMFCVPFRNPALLAKSIVAIDHVSRGRFEPGSAPDGTSPSSGRTATRSTRSAHDSTNSPRGWRSSPRCSATTVRPRSQATTPRSTRSPACPDPSAVRFRSGPAAAGRGERRPPPPGSARDGTCPMSGRPTIAG